MDVRAEVLKEHSKANAERIAQWAVSTPAHMQQVIDAFLHDEYRVVQRISHVVSKISDTHPQLIAPHMESMITRMQEQGVPVAVKRCVVRFLQFVTIPEPLQGVVMNVCFDLLANPNETVAVRVPAMTVLDKLSENYPEIRNELMTILQTEIEHGVASAGFKARAKKILKG